MRVEVGQNVTINESNTPAKVVKVDSYNVVVIDENGTQHILHHGEVTPQSFLTESE